MRFRILAAMLTGAVILGFGGYALARPDDPLAPITLFTGQISLIDAIVFAILSFITGITAYFAATPYGRPIAPLAVPTGLAIWTFFSGSVRVLMITNTTVAEKLSVYNTFLWESFFWFVLVALGYAGVLVAEKIKPTVLPDIIAEAAADSQKNKGLRYAMAIVASAVVAIFCIGIFAQDVKRFDASLGNVIGQPSTGQIAFAVILSFLAAAFLCKTLLNAPPILPAAAAVVVMIVAVKGHATPAKLTYMTEHWAAAYFPDSLCSILPIQAIAYAAIGSVAGFWLGVRYLHWHKHEREQQK